MVIPPLEMQSILEQLTVFATGFISVFALGFQSRNVNHGNYGWAAATSVFVGLSQALLWKHIIKDDSLFSAVTYAVAGALAITSSMYVHERFIKRVN
jgi:hypothetical protein